MSSFQKYELRKRIHCPCRCLERYGEQNLTLPSLSLSHDFTVLRVIHDVGWVHRNISISNVYEYRDGEVIIGKLGGLEYANKIDDNSVNSARMVILASMAKPLNTDR